MGSKHLNPACLQSSCHGQCLAAPLKSSHDCSCCGILSLCRPNPKYMPWFNVPLKAARVAVKVITQIDNEVGALSARASS